MLVDQGGSLRAELITQLSALILYNLIRKRGYNMKLSNTIKLATMGFKPGDISSLSTLDIPEDQIIELAKSGYSVKDINELISLSSEKEAESTEPSNIPPTSEPGSAEDKKDEEASINYKELFEAKEQEVADLKASVLKLQNTITHKDLGPDESYDPRKEFQEVLRSIY